MKKRYVKSEAIKKLEELAFDEVKKEHPNFPYPVKPKYSDNTTNGLTSCVIKYIEIRGFQAERINSIGQQIDINGAKRWVKGSSQLGTADVSATIQGRSVKIEIKCKATNDNYQSDDQKMYQKQIENAGGVYLIVRNFQDFFDWFNRKKK